ncbi:hypothetical protein HDK77DRAFT_439987 [Phyllosticta capitalensis]
MTNTLSDPQEQIELQELEQGSDSGATSEVSTTTSSVVSKFREEFEDSDQESEDSGGHDNDTESDVSSNTSEATESSTNPEDTSEASSRQALTNRRTKVRRLSLSLSGLTRARSLPRNSARSSKGIRARRMQSSPSARTTKTRLGVAPAATALFPRSLPDASRATSTAPLRKPQTRTLSTISRAITLRTPSPSSVIGAAQLEKRWIATKRSRW